MGSFSILSGVLPYNPTGTHFICFICFIPFKSTTYLFYRRSIAFYLRLTFNIDNKKPASWRAVCQVRSFDVIKATAIRKHKKRRCIRRTFGECLPVGLRLRMYLAQCHNANLRRIVRTIYKSLVQLPFERIGLRLFRAFCIGFESWLHLCGSMWAGRGRSPRFQQGSPYRRHGDAVAVLMVLLIQRGLS